MLCVVTGLATVVTGILFLMFLNNASRHNESHVSGAFLLDRNETLG